MGVPAGHMRDRVWFAVRGPLPAGATDFGSPMGDFERQFSARAWVRHLRGSEPVVQSRLEGRQPVIVSVWRTSNTVRVTEEWRVELEAPDGCDCRALAITAVTPADDRRSIDFLCVYGGAVG